MLKDITTARFSFDPDEALRARGEAAFAKHSTLARFEVIALRSRSSLELFWLDFWGERKC
jgi:hypothetical protein